MNQKEKDSKDWHQNILKQTVILFLSLLAPPFPEKPETERKAVKKSSRELVEKFLKEEPKIKPRTEFYNPVNMAKQSVSEDIEPTGCASPPCSGVARKKHPECRYQAGDRASKALPVPNRARLAALQDRLCHGG